jgi:two-component system chemotaxis sensor kinase CheA
LKQSIILKTLLILGSVIITISISSGYLSLQNDKELMMKIRDFNLNSAIESLDKRQELLLNINKKQMSDTIDRISKNSAILLLDYDVDSLKLNLQLDLKKEGIEAIKVWDSAVDELFVLALKDNTKIVFKENLPKTFDTFTKFKKEIYHIEGSIKHKLGEVTLYYDESIIINQINKLKNDTKIKIGNFNDEIDKQQSHSNSIKLYIKIGTLITILFVTSILLIIFVNNPLRILQTGLEEFFLFLQNKKDNKKE